MPQLISLGMGVRTRHFMQSWQVAGMPKLKFALQYLNCCYTIKVHCTIKPHAEEKRSHWSMPLTYLTLSSILRWVDMMGDVYKHLFEWALKAPRNKEKVCVCVCVCVCIPHLINLAILHLSYGCDTVTQSKETVKTNSSNTLWLHACNWSNV